MDKYVGLSGSIKNSDRIDALRIYQTKLEKALEVNDESYKKGLELALHLVKESISNLSW